MLRLLLIATVLSVSSLLVTALPTSAAGPIVWDEAFEHVWNRTDLPVNAGIVSRSWYWGPSFDTREMPLEPYAQSPGAMRLVQYFDKSRMEINNPFGNTADPWYVTNGLLVKELIEGSIQVGDSQFEGSLPSQHPVAGDPSDPLAPTYATLGTVLGRAPNAVGMPAVARLDKAGNITLDPALGADPNVQIVLYSDTYGHNIPKVFDEFMSQTGVVYRQDLGAMMTELIINPLFAMGYPITDPFWMVVKLNGVDTLVLTQAFERRVLTYTTTNPAGWQVEMGNVGQHYYKWRYGG